MLRCRRRKVRCFVIHLLEIFFMLYPVSKAKSSNEKVDMEELVGNTDGFAESG